MANGLVFADVSMSLDGFITGPNDSPSGSSSGSGPSRSSSSSALRSKAAASPTSDTES